VRLAKIFLAAALLSTVGLILYNGKNKQALMDIDAVVVRDVEQFLIKELTAVDTEHKIYRRVGRFIELEVSSYNRREVGITTMTPRIEMKGLAKFEKSAVPFNVEVFQGSLKMEIRITSMPRLEISASHPKFYWDVRDMLAHQR